VHLIINGSKHLVCFLKSIEIVHIYSMYSYFEKDKVKKNLPLSRSKKKDRTCEENVRME
jgi:hypothetical protein